MTNRFAEPVMVGQSRTKGRVELARLADGRWAVSHEGVTVGVWELWERTECFRVFRMLAGLDDPARPRAGAVVVARHDAPAVKWH